MILVRAWFYVQSKFLTPLREFPFWILGGALVGYLWILVWGPWVLFGADQFLHYNDEHAALIAVACTIALSCFGGFVGYRVATERRR